MSLTGKTAVAAGLFFIATEIAGEGTARSPRFAPRPARRPRLPGSGGTAGISRSSQQGGNDNGETANPRATAGAGAGLAAYASVSDFTGAIHGYRSDTSASDPPPPRPRAGW